MIAISVKRETWHKPYIGTRKRLNKDMPQLNTI